MSKIDEKTAMGDVERFMNAFKLDPIKKEALSETIKTTSQLVQAGMVVISEQGKIEYTLLEPVEADDGDVVLDVLKFKNRRIRVEEIEKMSKQNFNEIAQARELVGALVGVDPQMVKKITGDDMQYLSQLAVFFTPVQ